MELNYKEFGQGEPVIILHGLFGTLDNWQTIASQLAENFTVYIVDQRNHGRSPHTEEMNYTLMAEDLKLFMESNWIYNARIIGHSMGGKTAMQFALNYPDMVEQLAVIDITPKAYDGKHEIIFNALEDIALDKIESRNDANEQLQARIADNRVRQFLLKNLTRKKKGGYRWKMNLPVIRKSYSKILDKVEGDEIYEGPCLFVRGGKSNYIQDEDFYLIQESFLNARLETIENSGHWVHAEAPIQLYDLLIDFFNNDKG